MQRKKIRINNIDIAYYESKPEGSPVLMIHGDSLSHEIFQSQFTGHLGRQYRLIALDLPGHGDSAFCTDAEACYSNQGMMNIVKTFLQKKAIKNSFLIGHSYGGHLAMQILDQEPAVRGLAIIGTTPFTDADSFDKAFFNTTILKLRFKKELSREDLEFLAANYVSGMKQNNIIRMISQADKNFREQLNRDYQENKIPNDLSIIENTPKPVAIFHGVDDKLVDLEYLRSLNIENLWRNDVQLIEKASHCPQLENPGRFNQLLEYFLLDY